MNLTSWKGKVVRKTGKACKEIKIFAQDSSSGRANIFTSIQSTPAKRKHFQLVVDSVYVEDACKDYDNLCMMSCWQKKVDNFFKLQI